MSLTSGGHIVEVEKGKFIRTSDLVSAEDPPSLTVEERVGHAHILDHSVAPRRRLTEKTALSALSAEELQCRLHRGQAWANEEFGRLSNNLSENDGLVGMVYDLDQENEHCSGGRRRGAVSPDSDGESSGSEEDAATLEINNFDANKAIQRITEDQTKEIIAQAQEKGERAELIPGSLARRGTAAEVENRALWELHGSALWGGDLCFWS